MSTDTKARLLAVGIVGVLLVGWVVEIRWIIRHLEALP